jgi:hypothetical protein
MTTKPRLTVKFREILDLMERIIAGAEHEGTKTVELNTVAARIMLDLARYAPRPNTGQKKPYREKQYETLIFTKANDQRAARIAAGLPKAEARRLAVERVKQDLPHLSQRTILDRLSAQSRLSQKRR